MSDEILVALNRMIKEVKPEVTLEAGKHLKEDIGLDSLDIISLLFEAERHFDISIPEEDIDAHDLFHVDKLTAYIAQKRGH